MTADAPEGTAYDPKPDALVARTNTSALVRNMLHDRHMRKIDVMADPKQEFYDYLLKCLDDDIEMATRLLNSITIEVQEEVIL